MAIAAAVLQGDRVYAEQEKRRAEELARRKREVEERDKAEQLRRARQEYIAMQQAWAEKQYQAQGLWKRRPIEHFREEFEGLYPFPPAK